MVTDDVSPHVQVELSVVVRRGGTIVPLKLTPRPNWGGRGMLGSVASLLNSVSDSVTNKFCLI